MMKAKAMAMSFVVSLCMNSWESWLLLPAGHVGLDARDAAELVRDELAYLLPSLVSFWAAGIELQVDEGRAPVIGYDIRDVLAVVLEYCQELGLRLGVKPSPKKPAKCPRQAIPGQSR